MYTSFETVKCYFFNLSKKTFSVWKLGGIHMFEDENLYPYEYISRPEKWGHSGRTSVKYLTTPPTPPPTLPPLTPRRPTRIKVTETCPVVVGFYKLVPTLFLLLNFYRPPCLALLKQVKCSLDTDVPV